MKGPWAEEEQPSDIRGDFATPVEWRSREWLGHVSSDDGLIRYIDA